MESTDPGQPMTKELEGIDEAASNLSRLLPIDGPGLTWADVVEDNDLAGRWAPDRADLPGSVRTLLLNEQSRGGVPAVVRLIESASRLADHRHRTRPDYDATKLLALLEINVRKAGVEYSPVMAQIAWR